METILGKLQSPVQQYANVLSKILHLDVEIIDHQMVRIAGTGVYASKINVDITEEGYICKKAIQSRTMIIVENPGSHPYCQRCKKKDECRQQYVMCTPILLENRVIGVIGFLCIDETQRTHVIEQREVFAQFLTKIADLIASKAMNAIDRARHETIIHLLNSVLDKVDEGVLVLSHSNEILQSNSYAKKLLALNKEIQHRHIILHHENVPDGVMTDQMLILGDKQYHFFGRLYGIKMNAYDKVLIFKDYHLSKADALSITMAKEHVALNRLLGASYVIQQIKKQIRMIGNSSSTVLVTGESGTGKELVARALHEESIRKDAPFVVINCAAMPDSLLENELFGYVKGAFNGADPKGKIGQFELADKGTLFLDEISEMPLYLQAKLLKVIEEREIQRLGGTEKKSIDVRIIAATKKDLKMMADDKTFRDDLFYRLNVIPVRIPPLRERKEDIRFLAVHFFAVFSKQLQKSIVQIEDGFWQVVLRYPWEGNVRELKNAIEYVMHMIQKPYIVDRQLLPKHIQLNSAFNLGGDLSIAKMEKRLIMKALNIYGHDLAAKKVIAEKLGIGIATLYRKINHYHL